MSLLFRKERDDANTASIHPWEKTIKNVHVTNFHTAHNSIDNPRYPKKKEKSPDRDRVKFTVIGNRVTKEFIHCVNLVIGLHKYRWKTFDAPIIRGVTTVEWPKVWGDLKLRYGSLAYCLQSQVAVIINDRFLGGDKELREILESRYNYHLTLDYYKEGVDNFVKFVRSSARPCTYIHISIDGEYTGALIFMLYADLVPYTCENFLRLCHATKGGYSGTPIHRIVKDGWIQCGGFGLKSTDLDCENFIVPHDKRGVLCMANDGRHVDCSTQFFILLQPAPWMAHKYVAFGQLIDGESTLKQIESVPTYYESPNLCILIERAGVLNVECQDIRISKRTNEYLQGHIEDLIALGDLLYEELMEKVFLEIELKRIAQLEMERYEEEEIQIAKGLDDRSHIHATERFIRKKEDMETFQKSQTRTSRASSAISEVQQVNNDFDVESYYYEPEEYSYKHVSVVGSVSIVVKPEKPYYIPLTDVPYPGEKDSSYDLKKLLRGDYCLESDLQKAPSKKVIRPSLSYISEIYKFDEESDTGSIGSLSSDEEQEIRRYLKLNVDRVSFAGSIVKSIARGVGKFNIFEGTRKSELITDEELRRFRVASMDHRSREVQDKKVSISIPVNKKEPSKIKRRQTGFVRPEDLEKIYLIHKATSQDSDLEEDESVTGSRKVRIAESAIATQTGSKTVRKPTGVVPPTNLTESDTQVRRQSALSRLYDNMTDWEQEGPTLKDYKPLGKVSKKNFMLTRSPVSQMKREDSLKANYLRQSVTIEDSSIEQVLNLQHSKKTARKVSSDYVKTIDQIEHRAESSIRSLEFARRRPSLSVSEYQMKNLKRSEELQKIKSELSAKLEGNNLASKQSFQGLRLPGDTPLYSLVDMDEQNK